MEGDIRDHPTVHKGPLRVVAYERAAILRPQLAGDLRILPALGRFDLVPQAGSCGASSVTGAAYRSGKCLTDERTGEEHDHTDRDDLDGAEILAPRVLFALAPRPKPPAPSSDTPAPQTPPVERWKPRQLGQGQWGAVLDGEQVAALPESDQLPGTPIRVTDLRGDAWTTTIKAVVSRSDAEILVRTTTGRPLPPSSDAS